MKTGIVEMINGKKILVGFEDRTHKTYINKKKLVIKENDQVDIIGEEIVNVRGIDQKLFKEIKALEDSIFTDNKIK